MTIVCTAAASHALARCGSAPARGLYRFLTDIFETDENVFVVAEMPGVAAESVDITLEHRLLTIRGKNVGGCLEGYRQTHVEYNEGDYERVLAISEDIDKEQIKASHKNGVLTLELPKAAPVKTMKVKVNA